MKNGIACEVQHMHRRLARQAKPCFMLLGAPDRIVFGAVKTIGLIRIRASHICVHFHFPTVPLRRGFQIHICLWNNLCNVQQSNRMSKDNVIDIL